MLVELCVLLSALSQSTILVTRLALNSVVDWKKDTASHLPIEVIKKLHCYIELNRSVLKNQETAFFGLLH